MREVRKEVLSFLESSNLWDVSREVEDLEM